MVKKKARGKGKLGWWVAAVALMAAATATAGLYYFGVIGKDHAARDLAAGLERWTEEWRSGDASSLSAGMIFGTRQVDESHPAEEEKGALSSGELKAIMEEQYGELIETPVDTKDPARLFPILMEHTTVAYRLPASVEEGQWVTFEITGPDMTKIVPLLDANADQATLLGQLETLLASGDYEKRTVSAQAEIESLENGYRLRNSYELIDGLYGGLPGMVSDTLGEMGE